MLDHHVEKTYSMIQSILETDTGVQIIGGDFNAELGPGVGVEQTCVGQYTFKEANNRGEWMKTMDDGTKNDCAQYYVQEDSPKSSTRTGLSKGAE